MSFLRTSKARYMCKYFNSLKEFVLSPVDMEFIKISRYLGTYPKEPHYSYKIVKFRRILGLRVNLSTQYLMYYSMHSYYTRNTNDSRNVRIRIKSGVVMIRRLKNYMLEGWVSIKEPMLKSHVYPAMEKVKTLPEWEVYEILKHYTPNKTILIALEYFV